MPKDVPLLFDLPVLLNCEEAKEGSIGSRPADFLSPLLLFGPALAGPKSPDFGATGLLPDLRSLPDWPVSSTSLRGALDIAEVQDTAYTCGEERRTQVAERRAKARETADDGTLRIADFEVLGA